MNTEDALAWVDKNMGDDELAYSLRAAVVARKGCATWSSSGRRLRRAIYMSRTFWWE